MAIFRKRVLKQAIGGAEGKTEIMAIPNRYKDTFEDLLNSSDIKPPNMPRPVDKKLHNVMLGSENLPTELKLDKNISDGSQRQQKHCRVPIAEGFVRQQCHDTQVFGPKRDRKVREKKGIEGRWKGGVKPVVGEASIFEASVYYHIIY